MLKEILTRPFFIISLLLFIFFTKWLLSRSNRKFPPCPSKLPILGNLHQLGFFPHRSLRSLAQKYGPLMLLQLGQAPTLVVSSAEAAKEVLRTHDIIFANRPNLSISRKILYDYKDLSLSPYGEYWRQIRSICVLQLLSPKRVMQFRPIREQEIEMIINKIEKSLLGVPIDLSKMFASLTNDVICRATFGKKYDEQEVKGGKKFEELINESGVLLGVFNIGDFIPWLGWINYFNGLNAKVDKVFKETDEILDEIIDDHMLKNGINNIMEDEERQMDFVDVLLEIQKNSKDGESLGRDNLKAIILDMIGAGSETVLTTLVWTMTEMLRQPRVMKKVQEEIRTISRDKPNVAEEDIEKMHYLKAVIKESLRLHPPLALLIPHQSTEDVKVQGYDISAKTRVIVNAWAIGRDPKTWEEAEEFRPERFIGSSTDYKGHDFQLIPFGAGRRGCPGMTFAAALIENALASFLYKFDWGLPDGAKPEDLDMKEVFGISVQRKLPLVAVATPRSF